MAFMEVRFFSEALGLCCSANVILPKGAERAQNREIPVVWLLHGLSDDHTIWARRTAVERYAEELAPEFAVVMPAVDRSFYTDMLHGNRYWTYISSELPTLLSSMFPFSSKREDAFVAGLSMGGYGTLKLALNQPERFLACASFSGVCELASHFRKQLGDVEFMEAMRNMYGSPEEFEHSVNDLAWQAKQVAKGKTIPQIYMACGTSDFLYENNLLFLDILKKLNLPVAWEATPGRAHTWDYWDEQIQVALKWFVKLRNEAK